MEQWILCTRVALSGQPFGEYELVKVVEELGVAEILVNCMDCDGRGQGFDIDLLKLIYDVVNILVMVSNGASVVQCSQVSFNGDIYCPCGWDFPKEIGINIARERACVICIHYRQKVVFDQQANNFFGGLQCLDSCLF